MFYLNLVLSSLFFFLFITLIYMFISKNSNVKKDDSTVHCPHCGFVVGIRKKGKVYSDCFLIPVNGESMDIDEEEGSSNNIIPFKRKITEVFINDDPEDPGAA